MALVECTKTVFSLLIKDTLLLGRSELFQVQPILCFKKYELYEHRECAEGKTAIRCNIKVLKDSFTKRALTFSTLTHQGI